jgi:biotin operon repressor
MDAQIGEHYLDDPPPDIVDGFWEFQPLDLAAEIVEALVRKDVETILEKGKFKHLHQLHMRLRSEYLRARRLIILHGVQDEESGYVAPLTDGQRAVWDGLDGRVLSAKELAKELGTSDSMIRQYVHSLRKRGYKVNWTPGAGYYRPDAPPPDGRTNVSPT